MRRLNWLASVIAITGTTVLLFGLVCYAAGVRINTTKSIPVGIYWTSHEPVEKGAYVLFCPPHQQAFIDAKERGYIGAGFCPDNYGYIMKRILAAKGDSVSITDSGVFVNSDLLPLSQPVKVDGAGRPLPIYKPETFTLADSEVLLMSDVSGKSFDGRYFGPISRDQIKDVIQPVIIW